MLVKFTTANFLSFKEPQTLNMSASPISEYRYENLAPITDRKLKLLKGAALYGTNASGKSNLIRAMLFMKNFILDSSKNLQAGEEIEVEPFKLSTTTEGKPSFFEMQVLIKEFIYRYGFEVDKKCVHKEWLYRTKKAKEQTLFERSGQIIKTSRNFNFDEASKEKTRKNALVLSVSAQFNGEIATNIIKRVKQVKFISGTRDHFHFKRTVDLLKDKSYRKRILNLLSSAKLGFTDIKTENVKLTEENISSSLPKEIRKFLLSQNRDEVNVYTEHTVYNEDMIEVEKIYFDLMQNESLGTLKYFSLSGPVIEALIKGSTLIIDEFDARLHPQLSKSLIQLFNSSRNNKRNAQIVFATHNSNLLSSKILRRDQVIFTKKNDVGATHLSTLFQEGARKDASFEKEYFAGSYDKSIPKIEFSNQLNLFDGDDHDLIN